MKFRKTDPRALAPAYATERAACFDFFACIDAQAWPEGVAIAPGSTAAIGTGIAVQAPAGHALMMYSRYGPGYKYGVRLANATSIIDAECKWEIMVSLRNDGKQPFVVRHGDRIAQGMLIAAPPVALEEECSNWPACAP